MKTRMSVIQTTVSLHCPDVLSQGLEGPVVFTGNSVDLDEFTIRIVDGNRPSPRLVFRF